MSWSVSASNKSKEEIVDSLNESFTKNYSEPAEQVKSQFVFARDAVSELLDVVEGELFNCSLSGHSQAAMPGSAPDSMSISVYAVAPPVVVPPTE